MGFTLSWKNRNYMSTLTFISLALGFLVWYNLSYHIKLIDRDIRTFRQSATIGDVSIVNPNAYHPNSDRNASIFMQSGLKPTFRNPSTVDKVKNIASMINFLKAGTGYCEDILPTFDRDKPGVHIGYEQFLNALEKHEASVRLQLREHRENKEGFARPDKLLAYWHLARLPFVHTICETGFNLGYSTLLYLMAKNDTKIISFDLGQHGYARPMASLLQKQFPNRLEITWGDSQTTVPGYKHDHPLVQCDLLVIDGGHSVKVAESDLKSFRSMANEINLVIMDDHPALASGWAVGAGVAWERGKHQGEIHEFARCTNKNHANGFTFGSYI